MKTEHCGTLWLVLLLLLIPGYGAAQNPYYDHGAFPEPGTIGSSAGMRAELDLIEAGFAKLPTLSGNANKIVVINSSATAMTATDAPILSLTSLPVSPSVGAIIVITNNSSAGACNAAGGSNVTLCRWNGSAWVAIGGGGGISKGTTFPASPATDDLFWLTSDSAPGDCDDGGGTERTLCAYDGAGWVAAGAAGTIQGLSSVMATDRTYGEAVSQGTAARFGSEAATEYFVLLRDPTSGLIFTCEVAGTLYNCDQGIHTISGKKWFIEDALANKLFNFEPNASTPKAQYALGSKKILKSAWLGARNFNGDGTNCPSLSSTVTLNSGPKINTMICGSASNGDMDVTVAMPFDWDGGSLLFDAVYVQTAANTSAMNSDIKAQCRGGTEVPSSTWGSSVAIDDTNVTGSNAYDVTRSAAVTPAGTCAGGDVVSMRWTLDVSGTTTPEATLHMVGLRMLYYAESLSN